MKFLKKRSKNGFTLVELIIAMAVASILFLGITTTLLPSIKFFQQTTRWASDKNASNTIYRYVSNKIRFASEIYVYKDFDAEEFRDEMESTDVFGDDDDAWSKWEVIEIKNDNISTTGTGRIQKSTLTAFKNDHFIDPDEYFNMVFLDEYYSERNFDIEMTIASTFKMTINVSRVGDPSTVTHTSENQIALMNLSNSPSFDGIGVNYYYVYKMPDEPTAADSIEGGGGGGGGVSSDPGGGASDTSSESVTPATPTFVKLEAESASLSNNAHSVSSATRSNNAYVQTEDGNVSFTLPSGFANGNYQIVLVLQSPNDYKENTLKLNGSNIADIKTNKSSTWINYNASSSTALKENDVLLFEKSWGYINIDCVMLVPVGESIPAATDPSYEVSAGDHGSLASTATATGSYASGTSITAKVDNIDSSYEFECWKNGSGSVVSTNNPYTFTMGSEDVSIIAIYNKTLSNYNYSVSAGIGSLASGATSSAAYPEDTAIKAQVTVPTGYVFAGWSDGSNIVSSDNPYTFDLAGDISLTATYTEKPSNTDLLTFECESGSAIYKSACSPGSDSSFSGNMYMGINGECESAVSATISTTDYYSVKVYYTGTNDNIWFNLWDKNTSSNTTTINGTTYGKKVNKQLSQRGSLGADIVYTGKLTAGTYYFGTYSYYSGVKFDKVEVVKAEVIECEQYLTNYSGGSQPTLCNSTTYLGSYSGTGYAALNNAGNKQYLYIPFTAESAGKYSFEIYFARPKSQEADVYIDRYDTSSGNNYGQQSYGGTTYYHNDYYGSGGGSSSEWTLAASSGLTNREMSAGQKILIGLTDNKGRAYFDKIIVYH